MKKDISKFLKYNVYIQPFNMLFGLLGSVLAIRIGGELFYAKVVTFYTSYSLVLFLFSLGSAPTIIRFRNNPLYASEFDKATLLGYVLTVQIVVSLTLGLFLFLLFRYTGSSQWIDEYPSSTKVLMLLLVPLAFLSAIGRSILTADLENKIYLGVDFIKGLITNIGIAAIAIKPDLHGALYWFIFFVYFVTEMPVYRVLYSELAKITLSFSSFSKNKFLLVLNYYFTISIVRFSKVCYELPFVVFILNATGNAFMVAIVAVVYKIIGSVQKIIQLPIDRLLPSLFSASEKAEEALYYIWNAYKYLKFSIFLGFVVLLFSFRFIFFSIYQLEISENFYILLVLIFSLTLALSAFNSYLQMKLSLTYVYVTGFAGLFFISISIVLFYREPYSLIIAVFLSRFLVNLISAGMVKVALSDSTKILDFLCFIIVLTLISVSYVFYSGVFYVVLAFIFMVLLYMRDPIEPYQKLFIKKVLGVVK